METEYSPNLILHEWSQDIWWKSCNDEKVMNKINIYIIEVKIFENTLCWTLKFLNSSAQNDLVA
jgi:hypothetical protein